MVRCASCGLRSTHPQVEDPKSLYGDAYDPHAPPVERPRGGRRVLETHAYWIPDLPRRARVLEIGCGVGDFLARIADRGWRRHAVEPAPRAAVWAQETGADVFVGDLPDAGYPDAHFSAVCAWMALEHVPRLRAMLAEVARVLRPGGRFAFSVPNAGCWEFGFFRDRWFALQVPLHVSHFTTRDLRAALAGAGLAPERVEHQRNAISIVGSAGLRFRLPSLVQCARSPRRALQAALFPLAFVLAAIRQGGRITCVARKEEPA
ncbi:MAG: class I SAM-dependent methyltransferase [Planctomycetota bacterium]